MVVFGWYSSWYVISLFYSTSSIAKFFESKETGHSSIWYVYNLIEFLNFSYRMLHRMPRNSLRFTNDWFQNCCILGKKPACVKPCGKCEKSFKKLLTDNHKKITGPYFLKIEEARKKETAISARITELTNRFNIFDNQNREIEESIKDFEKKCAEIENQNLNLERSLVSRSI